MLKESVQGAVVGREEVSVRAFVRVCSVERSRSVCKWWELSAAEGCWMAVVELEGGSDRSRRLCEVLVQAMEDVCRGWELEEVSDALKQGGEEVIAAGEDGPLSLLLLLNLA